MRKSPLAGRIHLYLSLSLSLSLHLSFLLVIEGEMLSEEVVMMKNRPK